jgi:hypothetical protein
MAPQERSTGRLRPIARRPRRTRLLALVPWALVLVGLVAAAEDLGQTNVPPPVPQATEPVRYRVEVVAPDSVRDAVVSSVNLVRWQGYTDMTEELLDAGRAKQCPGRRRPRRRLFSATVDIGWTAARRPSA